MTAATLNKLFFRVKLSTFLGEIFQPHHRVEFFHPPREVEYSTFRVEILDHHFKWNFPPFSVTVHTPHRSISRDDFC
jgi:hypothetical protein